MRHVLTRLGIIAIVAWLALGATGDAAANTWQKYRPDSTECGFLGLINDYRADNGLRALTLSATLGAAAEHHSRDMAKNNVFSHTLSNGTTWQQNILDHRYLAGPTTAENIAAGRSSARGAFSLWVSSPGHRANMLDPGLYAIGIGRSYNEASKYGWYWTTTFGARSSRTITC